MSSEQLKYYRDKLEYEMDSWDVYVALDSGDELLIVVDGRLKEAYEIEHIPNSINLPL